MAAGQPLDTVAELLDAFDHSCRVTEHLVSVVPRQLWRADPPGGGRPIAGIVTHMQGVRRVFAKMGGADPVPPALDRKSATQAEARRALGQSREALNGLFRSALTEGRARVKGQPRRVVNMMAYLVQHDAHHRGQICSIVRALGHRLAGEDVMRIWGWKKLQ